jgi:hypothetical protein
MADNELDVRQLRKSYKHPAIFATYADLPLLGSFVLVNNHDPKHPQIVLVKTLDRDHGSPPPSLRRFFGLRSNHHQGPRPAMTELAPARMRQACPRRA